MAATHVSSDFGEDRISAVAGFLSHALGADHVEISGADRLSGGAVQENWRLDVAVAGGPRAGEHRWVLRTDAAARLPVSLERTQEFRVLEAAFAAGVTVAEPIADCADASLIGAPFMVQAYVSGSAMARGLVRAPNLATWGPDLAHRLGRELAHIHAITPDSSAAGQLGFLSRPERPPAAIEVAKLTSVLATAGEARPALAYILAWLDKHAPQTGAVTLVHGDFRTGNYLVDKGQLTAVLDWEFAHFGDPAEDLGWFCARCWRFGNDDLEAGGIAERRHLLAGYESVRPLPVTRAGIAYWEILAAAKWAAIAVLQGDRYRKGGENSIELVLTGLMPAEMEFDALTQIETLSKSLPR